MPATVGFLLILSHIRLRVAVAFVKQGTLCLHDSFQAEGGCVRSMLLVLPWLDLLSHRLTRLFLLRHQLSFRFLL